jgi:pilus assembly protein CpaB
MSSTRAACAGKTCSRTKFLTARFAKDASPSHIEEDLKGKIVRSNIDAGKPLLWEYLDRSTLESDLEGKRAVAINIDAQGSSTAGGFILPN